MLKKKKFFEVKEGLKSYYKKVPNLLLTNVECQLKLTLVIH
jgi:hypothetical protein